MSLLTIQTTGAVQMLTMDDAASANSLSAAMSLELMGALAAAPTLGARAVIITGAGRSFSAGHNLSELQAATPQTAPALFERTMELVRAIRALPVPVVAALNGATIGAGVQVALACDCIVASDTAYLQTQGGSKGWFCFTPAVELVHALPKQAAFELLFAGVRLSATRAHTLGIVNLVTAPAALLESSLTFAEGLIKGDPAMLSAGKRLINELSAPTESHYAQACQQMAESLFTESAQRRIQKSS